MLERRYSSPITVPGLLLVLIVASLLFVSCPASAITVSVYFDSQGNPARGLPGTAANSMRKNLPGGTAALPGVAYEFYPVSGKTFSEITASVAENGPYDRDGSRRLSCRVDWGLGLTYKFEYTYTIDEENGKMHAAIEPLGTELQDSGTVTLPSLIDDTALNPVEQNLWKSYYADIIGHCHDILSIIRDTRTRKTVQEKMDGINYLIFDFMEGTDGESTIESFLRDEVSRAGREWAVGVGRSIAEYDRTTAFGSRQERRGDFFKGRNN